MSASVEHQMTEIYCFVDDFLKTLLAWRTGAVRLMPSPSSVTPQC